MQLIVFFLSVSSDVAVFFNELSAGVIWISLWSSQGGMTERSIGFLSLADGGRNFVSLLAVTLKPF